MPGKNELLLKEQKDRDSALAEFALKSKVILALPDIPGPDAIYASGYCADATVNYTGAENVLALWKALPPLPCTYVLGDSWTVKPTSHLREQDRGRRRETFPLLLKYNKGASADEGIARWWTQLDDLVVLIQVAQGSSIALPQLIVDAEAQRYMQLGHEYPTGHDNFWVLRTKALADLQLQPSPWAKWERQWDEYAAGRGFSEKKLRVMRNMRMHVGYGHDLAIPDVSILSEAEGADLVAFANTMRDALPAVQEQIRVDLERAKAWFRDFFGAHGAPSHGGLALDDFQMGILRYQFHKQTGLAGALNWASFQIGGHELEIGYTLDKAHARLSVRWDAAKPPLDWDALEERY